MLVVPSRSGPGQDFEFEFGEIPTGSEVFLRVSAAAATKIARLYPDRSASETHLRWLSHRGESRLVIDVTGVARVPYDEAPGPLRKELLPWVEKFAAFLRKNRY